MNRPSGGRWLSDLLALVRGFGFLLFGGAAADVSAQDGVMDDVSLPDVDGPGLDATESSSAHPDEYFSPQPQGEVDTYQ